MEAVQYTVLPSWVIRGLWNCWWTSMVLTQEPSPRWAVLRIVQELIVGTEIPFTILL